MSLAHKSRPPLVKRYGEFIDLSSLNGLLETLSVAYSETRNEKVYRALKTLENIKAQKTSEFWKMEDLYRDEELREFFENPGAYPHAVRVWMMDYREKENA